MNRRVLTQTVTDGSPIVFDPDGWAVRVVEVVNDNARAAGGTVELVIDGGDPFPVYADETRVEDRLHARQVTVRVPPGGQDVAVRVLFSDR